MQDQYIRETVTQLLINKGMEEYGTESNLTYYIRKAKEQGAGGNKYLIALNAFDMIIFNEGSIAGRHYGILTGLEQLKAS